MSTAGCKHFSNMGCKYSSLYEFKDMPIEGCKHVLTQGHIKEYHGGKESSIKVEEQYDESDEQSIKQEDMLNLVREAREAY